MSFRAKTQVILRDRVLDESTLSPLSEGTILWEFCLGSNPDECKVECSYKTEVANRQDRFCRKLASMNSPLFIPFIVSND